MRRHRAQTPGRERNPARGEGIVAAIAMADAERQHSEVLALREGLIDCEQRLAVLPTWEEEARLAATDREELDELRDRVVALEGQLIEAEELRVRSERVLEEM